MFMFYIKNKGASLDKGDNLGRGNGDKGLQDK